MASTSTAKTTFTAKRILAAACALGFGGAALSAQYAEAQTSRSAVRNQPAVHHMAAGQSMVMIAPAAAVTSTAHYQAELELNCNTGNCRGNFPPPGMNRQLNVTRMSCTLISDFGSGYLGGEIELISAAGTLGVEQFLPVDFSSADGDLFVLNRAVDMQLAGNQHMRVVLSVTKGAPVSASCTATGTLNTLG